MRLCEQACALVGSQVLRRFARVEQIYKNGLFGRLSPLSFTKAPFDFGAVASASYDKLLERKSSGVPVAMLKGALQEKG